MTRPSGSNPVARSSLVSAVMVAVFLAAVDQTIVATALPRISAELGDTALYAWVFTSYMMATTVFVPIAGTIGDIHGRRPVLLFGVVVFAIGSMLAGGATSMTQLVGFRALQGVGAGVLTSNAFALLGDVYPASTMARATGAMSAVYGLAGAVGPVLGGLLTDTIGWRWIFWGNVPACMAIGAILFARLPRTTRGSREPLDVVGAVVLTAALLPALGALSWAGEGVSLREPRMIAALVASVFFAALFVLVERRAARPIIELHLFRGLTFTLAMATMFGVALAMYASLSYAPLLFQARMGMSASRAGAVSAALVVALALTSALAGRMVARGGGYRLPSATGVAIAAAGLGWLSSLDADASSVTAAATMSTVGAGLGLTMPTLLLAAQRSVLHEHLGVTTALAKFFRAVGGLVGVVAAGAVIRHHESGGGEPGEALSIMTLYAAAAMLGTLVLTLVLPASRRPLTRPSSDRPCSRPPRRRGPSWRSRPCPRRRGRTRTGRRSGACARAWCSWAAAASAGGARGGGRGGREGGRGGRRRAG
jgi:EmrB/QacA subfamily drug resistance transporter